VEEASSGRRLAWPSTGGSAPADGGYIYVKAGEPGENGGRGKRGEEGGTGWHGYTGISTEESGPRGKHCCFAPQRLQHRRTFGQDKVARGLEDCAEEEAKGYRHTGPGTHFYGIARGRFISHLPGGLRSIALCGMICYRRTFISFVQHRLLPQEERSHSLHQPPIAYLEPAEPYAPGRIAHRQVYVSPK
jgi:hypothetical protein